MAIHIDSDGNFYFGVSGTTDFDSLSYTPVFSVTKDGALTAVSGEIAGWELGSTYMRSENSSGQYIYLNNDGTIAGNFVSGTSGWRISADGDAEFNSIDIRIKASGASEGDVPSDGTQSIQIGSAQIYESNNNLYLNSNSSGNKIIVSAGDKFVLSGASANPNLTFDGAGTQDIEFNAAYIADSNISDGRSYNSDPLGFIYELTISNQNVDIYRINAQNNDVYFYGDVEVDGHIEVNSLKVYDGFGSSGEVLTRTTNGLEWSAAGGAHADSDHTSFASSSHSHTESDISNIGSHSHSNLDDYEKWILKGNGNNLNVLSGYGVEFKAGSGISLSVNTNPYEITFSHGGGTHVSSSTAVQALFPGGLRGSITLGSGTTGRFYNGISQSGQNYTWNTTTTFNGTPTFGGTINVGSNIFHPTDNDGNGFIGFSDNRFNRLYASNGVSTASDERLKENIEDIPYGLDYLNTLRPVQFEWIPKYKNECTICGCIVQEGNDNCGNCWEDVTNEEGVIIDKTYCACETISIKTTGDKKLWGFIAQELIETPPEPDIDIELIDYDNEADSYNMNYSQLLAPLVKAVQELSTQISDLTARVEALEG
jgi:hypothetical protein